MYEGEQMLPKDISEILLSHFYPTKIFNSKQTKSRTVKRLVRNMVQTRMEKALKKLNYPKLSDE